VIQSGEEPPSKKFKALFESVTTGLSQLSEGDELDSQFETNGGGGSPLRMVVEEEEEPQPLPPNQQAAGKKRKLGEARSELLDDEVVMDELLHPTPTPADSEPSRKKRSIEGVNDTHRAPAALPITTHNTARTASSANLGAVPGQPDTDQEFLKALASQKKGKGKSKEDEFDRDFNKLRIAKPDLHRARANGALGRVDEESEEGTGRAEEEECDPEQEWKVLEDFGDDSNLRGNFMVIHTMDVWGDGSEGKARREKAELERQNQDERVNVMWGNVPNYKKFRSVSRPSIICETPLTILSVLICLEQTRQDEYGQPRTSTDC
jgi:hypothetical protein